MRKASPSTNGRNGRTARGRFAKGNPGGPGNPLAAQIAKLRAELIQAVTPADVRAIAKSLVRHAKRGNIAAIRELLNRLLGQPLPADIIERIEAVEKVIQERINHART